MSVKKLYLNKNGEQDGPFNAEEIVEKMKAGEVVGTDYIFDQEIGDWKLVVELVEIAQILSQNKPKQAPALEGNDHSTQQEVKSRSKNEDIKASDFKDISKNPMLSEWYILKGENKFGPFPYTEVIKMLQEKVVFEFDFAWQKGMEAWCRIAEISEFQAGHIKKLQDGLMPEIENIFFRRKHPRVSYSGTILVHDNKNVWKGKGFELSAGGAGVVMDNAMLVPGQTVYLHFKPGAGIPAFNAICEIVSKKFIDGVQDKKTPICYGVKFKSVSGNTQSILEKFTVASGSETAA